MKQDFKNFKLNEHLGNGLCMNDGGCDCWEGHAAVVLTLCADEMTQPFGIFNILYLENENN